MNISDSLIDDQANLEGISERLSNIDFDFIKTPSQRSMNADL